MKTRKPYSCLLIFIFIIEISYAQVGNLFPSWTEGFLDIHHINTGRGDATFFILPDGTTLLVDAGAHTRDKSPRELDIIPNGSRQPGEWIARYISHMLPDPLENKLDYMLLTHFHSDHMGGINDNTKMSKTGSYLLSGVTEVAEYLPFKKLVDRAWPGYNEPTLLKSREVDNYKNFIKWNSENNGMVVEQFNVGRDDQIVLVNHSGKYENFRIRNIVANGVVWAGEGSNSKNHFPPLEAGHEDLPTENMNSIAIKLSYGNFDYFNGGDLLGNPYPGSPAWHDIETPVAKVVGPVEVNVTNHHGHFDAQNEFFVKTLRPKVHIIQSWVVNHPSPSTLSRMLSEKLYPGARKVFATNIPEVNKIFNGSIMDRVKGQGHIVIRVDPDGNTFHVFVLDDSDENYKVNTVYGPYTSE